MAEEFLSVLTFLFFFLSFFIHFDFSRAYCLWAADGPSSSLTANRTERKWSMQLLRHVLKNSFRFLLPLCSPVGTLLLNLDNDVVTWRISNGINKNLLTFIFRRQWFISLFLFLSYVMNHCVYQFCSVSLHASFFHNHSHKWQF